MKIFKTKDGYDITKVKTIYYLDNSYRIIKINLQDYIDKDQYVFGCIGKYQSYSDNIRNCSSILVNYLRNPLMNVEEKVQNFHKHPPKYAIEKAANFFHADLKKITEYQQIQEKKYLEKLIKVSDLIDYLQTLPLDEIIQFNNDYMEYGNNFKTLKKKDLKNEIKTTKNPLKEIKFNDEYN